MKNVSILTDVSHGVILSLEVPYPVEIAGLEGFELRPEFL